MLDSFRSSLTGVVKFPILLILVVGLGECRTRADVAVRGLAASGFAELPPPLTTSATILHYEHGY